MDWFLELVHDVDFRDRIGLVAIDECHLVSTWATFRDAYAKLFTLQANLLPLVAWFRCTATLTKEQEVEVLKFGGFRKEGLGIGELEIIRTSVDCRYLSSLTSDSQDAGQSPVPISIS